MLKIGDFSRLSQVSVKALRYYDEIGLLNPVEVDPFTNYRYYSVDQLPRLNRILALKDLGLSLDQIIHLLTEGLSPDQIGAMLRQKQAEIARQVAEEQSRLARVEARLRQIEQEGSLPDYEVVIKPVEPQLVVAVRAVIPDYSAVTPLYKAIAHHLTLHGIDPATCYPWIALYYDEGYKDQKVSIMAAAPLPRRIPAGEGLTVEELPGVPAVMSVVHRGPYDTFNTAYAALMRFMETNDLCVSGPNRQLYLHGPIQGAEPDDYVTEVQFPVTQRSTS